MKEAKEEKNPKGPSFKPENYKSLWIGHIIISTTQHKLS
jgi:hypothetical protein